MSEQFSQGVPEDAANWHPPSEQELDGGLTEEEIAAVIQILEESSPQVPTGRESPRPFYQFREFPALASPLLKAAETTQGSLDILDIFLSQQAENGMFSHLDSAVPLEAIGLFLGRVGVDQVDGQDRRYVELKEIIPMRPIEGMTQTTATSASITCKGWQRAWHILEYLRRKYPDIYKNVHIIGWYHQHPIGTSLSQMDVFLHQTAFSEPHQITFVRNSSNGATGIFYRSIAIDEGRRLIPTSHFKQTAGYYYEGRKPVAYEVMKEFKRARADSLEPVDIEGLKRSVRAQLRPWLTEAEIRREIREVVRVAAMIVLQEIIENPEIADTLDETLTLQIDDLFDFSEAFETAMICLEIIGDNEQNNEQNIADMIQIKPANPQRIGRQLRNLIGNALNSIGNALIKLGNSLIKPD